MLKKPAIFFLVLYLVSSGYLFSQSSGADSASLLSISRLQAGIFYYGEGRWEEAVRELSLIDQTASMPLRGEALFWTSLSKLSAEDYQGALLDMEALEIHFPDYNRLNELGYHKGRALFYLGRYNEAIVLFMNYANSFGPDYMLSSLDLSKKAATLFWTGECLYALGQFDRAESIFLIIRDNYPQSAKYEASTYRIALINQKKIEEELLALLNWNHQESLIIMEEYQRRESAYDQAILSYQRRIAEMMSDTRLAVLEASNAQYQRELANAENRIRELEARLADLAGTASAQRTTSESMNRLRTLRGSLIEIQEELQRTMSEIFASGAGR
ncbi:MAG: tetratricopeptide repeat protein [Treponema sp.]|jgi:TolA-binding protein|nr:tetratricopeptide repeat protein [Treponema sp.]